MKKIIAITAIMAISTVAYSATESIYLGAGYDGVSIKKDFTPEYTGQLSYGGFSDVAGFKGRILYKFQKKRDYNLYGFGGIVYGSDDSSQTAKGMGLTTKLKTSYTTKGTEFGAGVEYDMRKAMATTLPLYISLELGYRFSSTDVKVEGSASSKTVNYEKATATGEVDYSGVIGGLWFHYKF